jgi:hypothetical protein
LLAVDPHQPVGKGKPNRLFVNRGNEQIMPVTFQKLSQVSLFKFRLYVRRCFWFQPGDCSMRKHLIINA